MLRGLCGAGVIHTPHARSRACTRFDSLPSCPPSYQFIFVSPEEMAAVADFIRQRGRIAISELAAKSNQVGSRFRGTVLRCRSRSRVGWPKLMLALPSTSKAVHSQRPQDVAFSQDLGCTYLTSLPTCAFHPQFIDLEAKVAAGSEAAELELGPAAVEAAA